MKMKMLYVNFDNFFGFCFDLKTMITRLIFGEESDNLVIFDPELHVATCEVNKEPESWSLIQKQWLTTPCCFPIGLISLPTTNHLLKLLPERLSQISSSLIIKIRCYLRMTWNSFFHMKCLPTVRTKKETLMYMFQYLIQTLMHNCSLWNDALRQLMFTFVAKKLAKLMLKNNIAVSRGSIAEEGSN